MAFDKKQHYENSSLRENILEHLFIGSALRGLWQQGIVDVEILRSEFDAYGYDLVISRGQVVRHVQLKSGTSLKKVSVSKHLASKPSGCVVFICVDDQLSMGPFYYFGAPAGAPLPDIDTMKVARRATHTSQKVRPERHMHRELMTKEFRRFLTLDELLHALIGSAFLETPND
ncbi:hypothetical protein ACWKW9_07900 [Rhizobium daejeonense]